MYTTTTSSHAPAASYHAYSGHSSHRYAQPWEHSGGDPDPRSIPPVPSCHSPCHSPLSSQPRKKTKVASEHSAYIRSPDRISSSTPHSSASVPKRQSTAGYYEGWDIEEHQRATPQTPYPTSYNSNRGGGVPDDHRWYQGRSSRGEYGHSRRTSSGATANYSAYTTRPTNSTTRYDQRTPKTEAPLGLEDMGHSDHSTQFSDSGDSQGHGAPNLTRRHTYEAPWNAELPGAGAASEASAAAAQRAVSELFPELTSGDDQTYSSHSDADYSLYGRNGAYYYQPASSPSYQRRVSNAHVDPNYNAAPSSYGSGSSRGGSAASNYAAHDQRPRREYPSTLSPHPQSPIHQTHTLNSNPYYTVGQSTVAIFEDELCDTENDFDASDDSDDDDDDNESAMSAIIIKNTGSPTGYYPDSSASPSVVSVDTPGPGTPLTTKYSSPEIVTASNVDSVPKRQRQGVARTPKKLAQSATSSGPKRVRKPAPANAVAMAASTITHENYDDNDALLVYYRQMGVSYKTIKAKLGLDEAESTLRGRYRTLTKPKNERLRKPVWSEDDVILLLESVEPDLPHIKWKQVSDTIVQTGGSYRFGSSTCKKKYLELVAEHRAHPLCEAAGASKRRKHRVERNKA